MKKLLAKINYLRAGGCNLPVVLVRYLWYRIFFGKRILCHQGVTIRGVRNIMMGKDHLEIGLSIRGMSLRSDRTLLNINGELILNGRVNIARGCRIDVEGVLILNHNVSINYDTRIICSRKIWIGEGTTISWGVQLLDNDWHTLSYDGYKEKNPEITIGKRVWIGCLSAIYKGVEIADGCGVAGSAVIKKSHKNPHMLIVSDDREIPNFKWDEV